MREINRVKSDHGVLSVKLPAELKNSEGMQRGSYVVWVRRSPGVWELRTFDAEVTDAGKKRSRKAGAN